MHIPLLPFFVDSSQGTLFVARRSSRLPKSLLLFVATCRKTCANRMDQLHKGCAKRAGKEVGGAWDERSEVKLPHKYLTRLGRKVNLWRESPASLPH